MEEMTPFEEGTILRRTAQEVDGADVFNNMIDTIFEIQSIVGGRATLAVLGDDFQKTGEVMSVPIARLTDGSLVSPKTLTF